MYKSEIKQTSSSCLNLPECFNIDHKIDSFFFYFDVKTGCTAIAFWQPVFLIIILATKLFLQEYWMLSLIIIPLVTLLMFRRLANNDTESNRLRFYCTLHICFWIYILLETVNFSFVIKKDSRHKWCQGNNKWS